MNQKKTRFGLLRSVIALTLITAMVMGSTSGGASVAAKKVGPSISTSASVLQNGTKALTIAKNGYAIQKVVSVKSTKNAIARATAGKKTVTVYGIKSGKCKITVKVKAKKGKKGKVKNFTLSTTATVKAPSAKLLEKNLLVGTVTMTKLSNVVKGAKVSYSSSAKNIANVDKNGKVTAYSGGSAKITAVIAFPKTKFAKAVKKTFNAGTVNVEYPQEALISSETSFAKGVTDPCVTVESNISFANEVDKDKIECSGAFADCSVSEVIPIDEKHLQIKLEGKIDTSKDGSEAGMLYMDEGAFVSKKVTGSIGFSIRKKADGVIDQTKDGYDPKTGYFTLPIHLNGAQIEKANDAEAFKVPGSPWINVVSAKNDAYGMKADVTFEVPRNKDGNITRDPAEQFSALDVALTDKGGLKIQTTAGMVTAKAENITEDHKVTTLSYILPYIMCDLREPESGHALEELADGSGRFTFFGDLRSFGGGKINLNKTTTFDFEGLEGVKQVSVVDDDTIRFDCKPLEASILSELKENLNESDNQKTLDMIAYSYGCKLAGCTFRVSNGATNGWGIECTAGSPAEGLLWNTLSTTIDQDGTANKVLKKKMSATNTEKEKMEKAEKAMDYSQKILDCAGYVTSFICKSEKDYGDLLHGAAQLCGITGLGLSDAQKKTSLEDVMNELKDMKATMNSMQQDLGDIMGSLSQIDTTQVYTQEAASNLTTMINNCNQYNYYQTLYSATMNEDPNNANYCFIDKQPVLLTKASGKYKSGTKYYQYKGKPVSTVVEVDTSSFTKDTKVGSYYVQGTYQQYVKPKSTTAISGVIYYKKNSDDSYTQCTLENGASIPEDVYIPSAIYCMQLYRDAAQFYATSNRTETAYSAACKLGQALAGDSITLNEGYIRRFCKYTAGNTNWEPETFTTRQMFYTYALSAYYTAYAVAMNEINYDTATGSADRTNERLQLANSLEAVNGLFGPYDQVDAMNDPGVDSYWVKDRPDGTVRSGINKKRYAKWRAIHLAMRATSYSNFKNLDKPQDFFSKPFKSKEEDDVSKYQYTTSFSGNDFREMARRGNKLSSIAIGYNDVKSIKDELKAIGFRWTKEGYGSDSDYGTINDFEKEWEGKSLKEDADMWHSRYERSSIEMRV